METKKSKSEVASSNRNRGKRTEKSIAEIVNGARIGIFGGEDIITDDYSFEIKSREKFVGKAWMEQAERNASKKRIPIVVLHLHKTHHTKDIVMIRLPEFLKIMEKLKVKYE